MDPVNHAGVLIRLVIALSLVLPPAAASAQDGSAEGAVRLDLVRGPLITSSRITGLGGAFVGVAEGIDGIYRNPAALANRSDDATDWFDVDVTLDWLIVSSADIDWDGDGHSLSSRFEFRAFNLGLVLQFGPLGVGLLGTFYGWSGPAFSVDQVDVLLGAGWAFAGGEVIVGAGAALTGVDINAPLPDPGDEVDRVELFGAGADIGVLWRPRDEDWRLGLRFRTPSELTDRQAVLVDTGSVPWQLALGWSHWFPADDRRRYNPPLRSRISPTHDRRYLLLSIELGLMGVTNGASVESLVGERGEDPAASGGPIPSGERVSVALHLGAEGEVLHDRLRARVGTYLEPVRAAGREDVRLHMTGGIDVHLFELLFDWKANFAFDVAPGWINVSVGVGFWK